MVDVPKKPKQLVPRWALEDYEGAESEFSEWLLQGVYWSKWDGKDVSSAADRALAEAKDETIRRTIDMHGLAERALAWQLYRARTEEWIYYLGAEYESFDEYLQILMEGREADAGVGGSYWDWKFLIKTLMPVLAANGIEPERLMALKSKWSKMRAALPSIRRLIEDDDPDLAEKLKGYLDQVADDSTSVREFRAQLRQEKPQSLVKKMHGTMYIVPEGFVLAVDVPTQIQVTAIQAALSALVSEWSIGDAYSLGRKILDGRETDGKRTDGDS